MAERDDSPDEQTRGLGDVASRVFAGGETLTNATAALTACDPGVTAFGGDGPGRLGDFARELYQLWQAALNARAREAAQHGERLIEVATVRGGVAAAYTEVDQSLASELNRLYPDSGNWFDRRGPTGGDPAIRPDAGME